MGRDTDTLPQRIPADADLSQLRALAADCTACDLHRTGTRTVFGAGPPGAALVLVGEQPGDQEDLAGEPFVGPAGRELDRGLAAAGLGGTPHLRTNAVKHFKWSERRGKRRIHETPTRYEIDACLPWLRAELAVTRPRVVVALGRIAAQAVIAPDLKVTRERGRLFPREDGGVAVATVHPSSVLRARDEASRAAARDAFVDDLATVAALLDGGLEAALRRRTVAQLQADAAVVGLVGRSSLRKDDLVAALADTLRDTGAR